MKEDEKGKGQEKIRDLASAYRKKKGKAPILPNPLLVPREPVEEKSVKQEEAPMEVAKDKKPFRAVMQDAIESWGDIKKESHRPIQFAEGGEVEERPGEHLVHYSQHEDSLETLDPTKHGSGRAGQELRRGKLIPRTYYYEAGSDPETLISDTAKHRYVIPRPKNIIDLASEEAQPLLAKVRDINELEELLHASGYHGYKNSAHPQLGNAVALFHPQKPISTKSLKKYAEGGPVMMQAGGDPGMNTDLLAESPLFQQMLSGEETPLPTPAPTATPQPTQFQSTPSQALSMEIDLAESPLFQEMLREAPEGDLSAPTEGVATTPAGKEKPLATTFTREYAPVWDISGSEPKLTTIPHEDVMTGIASGKYAFDKAASVPMKFADGEVIPVPADKVQEALGHQMTYATPKDIAQFKYGDQTGTAFAEGLARGVLSAPVTTAIEKAFGVDPEGILARQELGAATAGELVGFAAPLLLTGGAWTAAKAGLTGTAGALKGASKIASLAPFPTVSNIVGGAAAKGVTKATSALPKLASFTAAEVGRGALEMALYDAQHQLSNHMLGAPPDDSILASLGLSSVLGGAVGGGLGLAGYSLGKLLANRPASGLSAIFHHGKPGEIPPSGAGVPPPPPPGVPPVGGATEEAGRKFLTPEELRETGVATPRWITQAEAPVGTGPMPEGYFPPQEPKIEIETPLQSSTPKDELTEALESFGEPPKIEVEEPRGLFSESYKGGWIRPDLAEGVANGNLMALADAFPEEILPKLSSEYEGLTANQMRKKWNSALEGLGIREKADAEVTRAAINRITGGKLVGDQVPLSLLVRPTGGGKLLHHLEQIVEDTGVALGMSGARTPAENKAILLDSIDEKMLQLFGEYGGKDPVDLGKAIIQAIKDPLLAKNEILRLPFIKYDQALANMPLLESERALLKQQLEARLKTLKPSQKGMAKAFENAIEEVSSTNVPTVGSLRGSMQDYAKQAFEPLETKVAQEGYWEVWKILKDFERGIGENMHLDPRLSDELRAEMLQNNTWKKKLEADTQWRQYIDDLRFLGGKLGAPKNVLTEPAQILKWLSDSKNLSPDKVFEKLALKNINYNEMMRIADREKGFPQLAKILRSVEKSKILASAQSKKPGAELGSFVADMKKMNKERRAFIFNDVGEMQTLEDLIQIWRNFGEKNWSNTAIQDSIQRALERAQQGAFVGGLPGAALAVTGEMQKGTIANIFLKGARKIVKRNPKGRYGMPADTANAPQPKKYAEGGMVTADEMPVYNRQSAFVQAVNQPPHIQEAHRIANALVKSDKMITNSVKSIFDPKSAYKIAQSNPKNVEKLKGYIDQIHRNPQSVMTLGSEIAPEFNTPIARSASSAAQFIKSLEPKAPQSLPFDSNVKAPPSAHVDIYNHVLRVAEQPLSVLHKVKIGTVIPEEVQAVETIYPDLYKRLQNELTEHLVNAKTNGASIPYRTKLGLSAFLGSPIDTTMTPEAIQSAQPQGQGQPQQGGQPGGAPKRSTSGLDKMATMAQTPGQARMGERSKGR